MNEEAARARAFVRDVEAYVAGAVVQPVAAVSDQLLERARDLAPADDGQWLRWGMAGTPMTGEQIAAHAEAATDILQTVGWSPSCRAGRGIRDALLHAEQTDPQQRFDLDTRMAVGEILGLLIRATTGAPHAYYEAWDAHPARTVEEVLGMLRAASAFARRYTPAN